MVKRSVKKQTNSDDKLAKIDKVVKLVYASAFLKNKRPLSILLVAPPSQSKTHFILGKKTRFSHISSDLSFMGVIKNLTRNKGIKHLIIPDFIKITGKKKSTTENLLGLLNNFLEEGIFSIDLGNREEINFKGRTGGIITATTESSYRQNIKNWEKIGFSSRLLIVSWRYSEKSLEKIKKIINEEDTEKQKIEKLTYKVTDVKSSREINEMFNEIAGSDLRTLIQFQHLAKCCALVDGRDKVLKKDVREVLSLREIINDNFTLI